MDCQEAQLYVSEIYDGEQVPGQAAEHVENCSTCRDLLHIYAQIGVETRLLSHRITAVPAAPTQLMQSIRRRRRNKMNILTRGVWVPRFGLIAFALVLLIAVPASWPLLHAQSKSLWFQFELGPDTSGGPAVTHIAKSGYKNEMGWMFSENGSRLHANPNLIGAQIRVASIEDDSVELTIAARNFGTGNSFPGDMHAELAKVPERSFRYSPGETLQIPVDGGGALNLRGTVVDHQPKIAWGHPLEPDPGELILSSPILIEGNRVLVDMSGATTFVRGDKEAARLYSPGQGLFSIGLRPFPGAVKGKAEWGRLTFELGGKHYMLVAGSPICGGDQPHPVWVALDASFIAPDGNRGSLGTSSLESR